MNSNAGAVAQLWLFITAPLIGAGLAGVLYREGAPGRADRGLKNLADAAPIAGDAKPRDGTAEAREAATPYNSVVGQSLGSPTTSTAPRELDQGAAEWGGNA